jgi:hypothetical protein
LIAFAALSSQPWLAERVTLAVLLAPVAFVTHITSLPLRLSAMTDTDKVGGGAGGGGTEPLGRYRTMTSSSVDGGHN